MLPRLILLATLMLIPAAARAQSACGVKGDGACPGCSATCPAGKQAFCVEGEGTGQTCWEQALCACVAEELQTPPVPAPGPEGGPNPNACAAPQNGPCPGCSASCPADERPACLAGLIDPADARACRRVADCRCVR